MMDDATHSHSMPALQDEGHHRPHSLRRVFLLVGAAVVTILVVGSVVIWAASRTMKSTVEGPSDTKGSVVYNENYAPFTMLTWNHYRSSATTGKNDDEVLKLLILDNLDSYERESEGHSSTETDYAVHTGYTFAENENNDLLYQYKAITWRNRTVDFSIEDALYDLDEGNVFLIRVKNGDVEVQQIYADLSDVDPWSNRGGGYDVQAFCETNEDVLAFLKEQE